VSYFDIEVAHSVEQVDQAAWDYLGKRHPFASYRWYRFGEKVWAGDTPVYIILSHNGEPMARATFWLTRRERMPSAAGVLRRPIEALIRRWPLLICHSPLASSSGLILPEPPLRAEALKTIAEAALDQAQTMHASFVVFDYLNRQAAHEPGWPETFASATLVHPGTYMDIIWPDFDSYLNHLSYKTRKNYRRYRRAADRMGVEIKSSPTVTQLEEALVLIRNVEQRHREPPYPWTRPMLENAAMVDAAWLTAEINGRLVGCELMLGDGDTWLVTMLGLDYGVQYVYFRLGYADIQYAIEHGIRRLRWGSCVYEVKHRLGFKLEDNNYVTFATHNRLLSWIGRRFASPSSASNDEPQTADEA